MSDVCPCCDSVVYTAEKAAISGKKGDVYHKKCLKCCMCNKRLDSVTFNEHDGQLYCKTHYCKVCEIRGYGYGQGAGTFHHTQ